MFVVRKMAKTFKWLRKGVTRVGRGRDIEKQHRRRSSGDFGREFQDCGGKLCGSFNRYHMTGVSEIDPLCLRDTSGQLGNVGCIEEYSVLKPLKMSVGALMRSYGTFQSAVGPDLSNRSAGSSGLQGS